VPDHALQQEPPQCVERLRCEEIVDSIRALKRRPDEQILVAGIFGWAVMPAGAHYQYVLTRPGLDLAPVCNSMAAGSGGEGYPGLRLKAFVESFGASGTFASICEDAIGPGLMGFAQKLASRL
ncbi:MAG TPA: hypothetical protein VN914_08195, partial [Polyangia bacterium]|nr:hypothetical protein [Polyangia bacterium]